MQKLVVESAVEVDGRTMISCARAFQIHRRHGLALAAGLEITVGLMQAIIRLARAGTSD
jgi:hypothetical protein